MLIASRWTECWNFWATAIPVSFTVTSSLSSRRIPHDACSHRTCLHLFGLCRDVVNVCLFLSLAAYPLFSTSASQTRSSTGNQCCRCRMRWRVLNRDEEWRWWRISTCAPCVPPFYLTDSGWGGRGLCSNRSIDQHPDLPASNYRHSIHRIIDL